MASPNTPASQQMAINQWNSAQFNQGSTSSTTTLGGFFNTLGGTASNSWATTATVPQITNAMAQQIAMVQSQQGTAALKRQGAVFDMFEKRPELKRLLEDLPLHLEITEHDYGEGKGPGIAIKINPEFIGGFLFEDGTVVEHIDGGKWELSDEDAKVVYRANRVREFNEFINVSDKLEEYVRFLGSIGVKQSEVMDTPLEVFINWVIMQAAMKDGEDVPELLVENHPALPAPRHSDRCRCCGRFIESGIAAQGVPFCGQDHMLVFVQRNGVWP